LNKEKQMPSRTLVSLWGIAIAWAIIWTVLHFTRPASFPWVGVPAGFLVVAPLLALNWIEQRKERERAKREQHERKPDETGLS
jgi:hypothetical protein